MEEIKKQQEQKTEEQKDKERLKEIERAKKIKEAKTLTIELKFLWLINLKAEELKKQKEIEKKKKEEEDQEKLRRISEEALKKASERLEYEKQKELQRLLELKKKDEEAKKQREEFIKRAEEKLGEQVIKTLKKKEVIEEKDKIRQEVYHLWSMIGRDKSMTPHVQGGKHWLIQDSYHWGGHIYIPDNWQYFIVLEKTIGRKDERNRREKERTCWYVDKEKRENRRADKQTKRGEIKYLKKREKSQ